MRKIKVKTPAKINLTLEVLNRREDGFHNIQSIMQTINLYDFLTFEVIDSNCIQVILSGNSDEIPYDEKNLVYKAALKFLKSAKIDSVKVSIYIEKNIPVSAGLAGGSTNAAGTFFALNKLFNPEKSSLAQVRKPEVQRLRNLPKVLAAGHLESGSRAQAGAVSPCLAVLRE